MHRRPKKRRPKLKKRNANRSRGFYCEYCDVFVPAGGKERILHSTSPKHMRNVESFYARLAVEDPLALWICQEAIQQSYAAALKEKCNYKQQVATSSHNERAVLLQPSIRIGNLPLPPLHVAGNKDLIIRVGGQIVLKK